MKTEDIDRYSALIICKNSEKRSRLKMFLRESMVFNVISNQKHDDISAMSTPDYHYDYIFYSDDFPPSSLAELKVKIKENSTRSTYIIAFSDSKELPSDFIVKTLLAGANGILLSPYSLYNLMETCNLPQSKTVDRSSSSRLNVAVNMLIKESIVSSSSPSMIQKVPQEIKEFYKNDQINTLSQTIVQQLSKSNYLSRVNCFNSLYEKVRLFMKTI